MIFLLLAFYALIANINNSFFNFQNTFTNLACCFSNFALITKNIIIAVNSTLTYHNTINYNIYSNLFAIRIRLRKNIFIKPPLKVSNIFLLIFYTLLQFHILQEFEFLYHNLFQNNH